MSDLPGALPLFVKIPGTADYIFDGHAGASPSGAERWMNCTASLEASRRFLETLTPGQQARFAEGSAAARQGTTAHAAGEVEARVLLGEMDQAEANATLMELAIMPESGAEAYDDEMAEFVSLYVDLVKQYIDAGHQVLIEQRVSAVVPLDGVYEGETYTITGSGDCVSLPTETDPTLTVIDLKYGEGINVDPEANPQVRIYGLGALAGLVDDEGSLTVDIETIEYVIVQPRNGGIKTWSESLGDLLDWRDEVLSPALTAALYGVDEGGATYSPSEETCQWCPAKGACGALAASRVSAATELFDTIVEAEYEEGPGAFPETGTLSNAQLGALLKQARGIVKIAEDLKAEAERRLHRGEDVPGYWLVNYSPQRKWKEGAEAALDEVDAVWQRKILSPAQALALLEKQDKSAAKAAEQWVEKPPKRPVISTGETDKRSKWEGRAPEDMFPDLSE